MNKKYSTLSKHPKGAEKMKKDIAFYLSRQGFLYPLWIRKQGEPKMTIQERLCLICWQEMSNTNLMCSECKEAWGLLDKKGKLKPFTEWPDDSSFLLFEILSEFYESDDWWKYKHENL